MTTTIALAGKGGVGKTTVAGLVIKFLVHKRNGSILAIDADPSSNLNMVLGLDLEWTVGDIREGMLEKVKESLSSGGVAMGSLPGGITKRDYLNYEIRSALSEGDRFDLIAMGRSEGPGCYCAVNHNLREVVDAISKNYQYLVIDNEAGMEHLSRRTTRDVQHLLIISDASLRGLVAAERIFVLRNELDIRIEKSYLLINKSKEDGIIPVELEEHIKKMDIPLMGFVPLDSKLADYDAFGKSLIELGCDSVAYKSIEQILENIL